ncbi:EAL and HDOD domain-containing protein [Marinobacterium arenosum]|uniref:EAL and HDOD domain-containing protein n=1 Tax=Marinobacterium arenosum TaxID=2862496 RepID=UPI001C97B00E|nr:HDOD domain-containing protein [Marinobacterium arenosum]MBY4678414.1 HDOD domain-containing protein [Marinobacterium arenosum]
MGNPSQLGQVLMARQPIFDRNQKVVAYELLYRNEDNTEEAVLPGSGSSATSEVILNVYTSINQAGETKRVPAFINLTRELLIDGHVPDLPKRDVVIEVLEDSVVDEALIDAVRNLSEAGYRIALDDFEYTSEWAPLLELADIVKIDVYALSMAQVREQIKLVKPFRVTLLAEKIESYEVLEQCIELGFKLFQGHFLSKPKLVKGRKLESNELALMQLIQELQNPSTTPERLETLIVMDPVLTYRLLRIVNSAANNLVRKVQSVAEAIVLLGLAQIRKWATLIAMTASGEKPEELTRSLLLRGRMCELVAEKLHMANGSAFFMTGMMSGLDAVLDVDKQTLLDQVPLDDEIKAAIADGAGLMGKVLENVVNYEKGEWDLLPSDLNCQLYDEAYRDSLRWTQASMQALHD